MEINPKKLLAQVKSVVSKTKIPIKKDEKPSVRPPEEPASASRPSPYIPKVPREAPPPAGVDFVKKEEEGIITVEVSVRDNFGERIGGELSVKMYQRLKPIMTEMLCGQVLVLDFAGVWFVDSSGLGSIMAINSTLLKKGGNFILKNPSDSLRGLLHITGLDRVIKII